ncbi:TetR/AcrR family transcriptional regulator [Haloimpatiens sp. FM7330]|uniref:TetR/AcrR family transcriptional regulator n=1 Tax=Haloimpatiens sp. FM7330 TaxID=3298610 RepID=UPI003631936E
MDKKLLQKRRIMGYFIDATNQIIENDGLENVTIRKVADIAGYNSSTLYNYFKNLDHLILFSSMKYLKDYTKNLHKYIKNTHNSLERYFAIWECFCYYSFNNPKIYNLIFFSKFSNSLNSTIKEYYSIFPDELDNATTDLNKMLLGNTIYERALSILKDCANDGYIIHENLKEINEMTILIYQSILNNLLNHNSSDTIDECIKKALKYFKQIIKSYQII